MAVLVVTMFEDSARSTEALKLMRGHVTSWRVWLWRWVLAWWVTLVWMV